MICVKPREGGGGKKQSKMSRRFEEKHSRRAERKTGERGIKEQCIARRIFWEVSIFLQSQL